MHTPRLPIPPLHRFRARISGAISLIPAFLAAYAGAHLLRFDGDPAGLLSHDSAVFLLMATFLKVGVFAACRITRSWHSFASFTEVKRIARATIVSAAMIGLACFLAGDAIEIPRSIPLLDTCLTGGIVAGWLVVRRSIREHRERAERRGQGIPVAIVGDIGPTSEALIKVIYSSTVPHYEPVGLVTVRERMVGREVAGVPIIGLLSDVTDAITSTGAAMAFVVQGQVAGEDIRRLVESCRKRDIEVRIIPSVEQLLAKQVDVRPREVAIEDLLGRTPAKLDKAGLHDWLGGKTILVTGSCGSIGSEIARQLLKFKPRKLVLMDRSETGQFFLGQELAHAIDDGTIELTVADATDQERIESLFNRVKPDVVFHAAAYKHVPLMEAHPGEAVKNIVGATRILADAAHAAGCQSFVMISTDKAVNPTNVMGCCKRVAELYVQALSRQSDTKFITVRFGNVLGSNGSVIPIFRQQIAAGGPVTVTHPNMTRYFMTIPEASQLVLQAGMMGSGGEIFVLDMGEPVKILDMAKEMIRLSGLREGEDIKIEFSGLRPGEKMYEELYTSDEARAATAHPKILCARSERKELFAVRHEIEQLLAAVHEEPSMIKHQLQRCVPRYQTSVEPHRRKAA